MAGHNPHPQAETLQATSSESSETLSALRNLRDPFLGLISELQNFAHLVQVLEDYLEQGGWEQGAHRMLRASPRRCQRLQWRRRRRGLQRRRHRRRCAAHPDGAA